MWLPLRANLARLGLALASVSLMAACGTGTAGAPSEADVRAVEANLAQTYAQLAGTPEQISAMTRKQQSALHQAQADCVAKYGLKLPDLPFIDQYAGQSRPGPAAEAEWLTPVDDADRMISNRQAIAVAQRLANEVMTSPDPYAGTDREQAYNQALAKCDSALPEPGKAAPDGADELLAQLYSTVEAVDAKVDGGGYADCMSQQGYDAANGHVARSTALDALNAVRPTDIPEPGEKGEAKQWQDAVTMTTGILAADASCRGDIYAAGMAQLSPALDSFAADNRQALDGMTDAWSALG